MASTFFLVSAGIGTEAVFAEPIKIKPALLTIEQHYFEFEPAAPEFFDIQWFAPLASPYLLRVLPTSEITNVFPIVISLPSTGDYTQGKVFGQMQFGHFGTMG